MIKKMKRKKVTIVDYGLGNLLSLKRAFEFIGADVIISNEHKDIIDSPRIILPGVGAFPKAMEYIKNLKLDEILFSATRKEKPLLGICLGMQLLLSESEEFSLTKGLDLISGKVIPIPKNSKDKKKLKIPHVGWNSLILSDNLKSWDKTILRNNKILDEVYFVHSFMVSSEDVNHNVADCIYGDHKITAAIQKENIFGCQFHPEKSGKVGIQVLKSFLEL